jgi:hypothetical protein
MIAERARNRKAISALRTCLRSAEPVKDERRPDIVRCARFCVDTGKEKTCSLVIKFEHLSDVVKAILRELGRSLIK